MGKKTSFPENIQWHFHTAQKVWRFVQENETFTVASLAKGTRLSNGLARFYVTGLLMKMLIEQVNEPTTGEARVYSYCGFKLPEVVRGTNSYVVLDTLQSYAEGFSAYELWVNNESLAEYKAQLERQVEATRKDLEITERLLANPDLWKKKTLVDRLIYRRNDP